MIADLPILFSGAMVRALLAGEKTQTRRLRFNMPPSRRLWVRETYCVTPNGGLLYAATDEKTKRTFHPSMKWRSPIYMFRKHSRITLVVTGTKLERLQTIRTEDAIAEGARFAFWDFPTNDPDPRKHVLAFSELWDDLNGAGAWASNPLVTAVTFAVHVSNIDKLEAA